MSDRVRHRTKSAPDESARPHEKKLIIPSRWQKLLFGALGGATISLFGTLLSPDRFFTIMQFDFDAVLLSSALSKYIFMSLVGGVTALVTKPKTPSDAFIRGMAVPLLISLLLSFGFGHYILQPSD